MRIRIDDSLCVGHARCWEAAPDLLVDDDDGRGVVRDPNGIVPPELEDQACRAANVCPERAVIVTD